MATAVEQAFIVACGVAEQVRQVSVATALATYAAAGYAGSALAAYRTAVLAATDAYILAVEAAAAAQGVFPAPCLGGPFGGTNAFVGNTPGIQGGQ
jgi:hypothetical protein